MERIYASVTLIELFILTLLQLCYLWYIITILVLKFVLILPVFYYYVTLNFFYCPPTFGSPCILTALAKKLIFFIIRRDKESS